MKRIMRQYAFTVAFILCFMSFFIGIITVREKTQYNMDMSPYSTVSIDGSGDEIRILSGGKETVIRREDIEKLSKRAFLGALGDGFVRLGNIFQKNSG